MNECSCHPETEQLMSRLGSDKRVSISEMVQRTIDHVCSVLTTYAEEQITENDLDITLWKQDIFQNNKNESAYFIIITYGDDSNDVFVSINGCKPKQLTYPGPLFWAAVRDQRLSGNLENKEYWDAIVVDEY